MANDSTRKFQDTQRFSTRIMLVQILAELVLYIPNSKLHILTWRPCAESSTHTGHESSNSSTSVEPAVASYNNAFIDLFINELLPSETLTSPANIPAKTRSLSEVESYHVMLILTHLCFNEDEHNDAKDRNSASPNATVNTLHHLDGSYLPWTHMDVKEMRSYVLDGICRSFYDLSGCNQQHPLPKRPSSKSKLPSLEEKYRRYYAMADLITRILTFRSSNANTGIIGEDKTADTIGIGQILLEKGYVVMLTSVLGDIDLDYPDARTLVDAILRPLELLTKLANVINSRNESQKKATGSPTSPVTSVTNSDGLYIALTEPRRGYNISGDDRRREPTPGK